MSDNPYAAPPTTPPAIGVLSGSQQDLLRVAKYQKGILVCILIYLVAVFGQTALSEEQRTIGIMVGGITAIVGAVFVFLLAMKTYGTVQGILLGILALVPLVGLLVLLMVNGKATSLLKQNGIRVGLLGADLSAIRLK